MRRLALVAIAGTGLATLVHAQETPSEPPRRDEVVVVSATRTNAPLGDAPATVSVIDQSRLATTAATAIADVLRTVPGTNVVQMSARDMNLTSRQATSTLANSQLVLLDGRSIYLDFFGIVMWDFLPVDLSEIEQIEVIRGPASAVWGANALTGVIHILTKATRGPGATTVHLCAGAFGREGGSRADDGPGFTGRAHLSWSGAVSEKLAARVSGGWSASSPLSRPVGTVPKDTHPLDPSVTIGGGAYPADASDGRGAFLNQGTRQPRLDLRVDHDLSSRTRLTYAAGLAGSEGIVHSGIGPFRLQRGSRMAYGRVALERGALHLQAFTNQLDADAPNLLLTDPFTGDPVLLRFETGTYDIAAGYSRTTGSRNVVMVGGNARHSDFEVSLAPGAPDRNELGFYLQDDIIWRRVRLAIGARLDSLTNLGGVILSPRLAATVRPVAGHSLRLSFNRAFRSPSVISNSLEQAIEAPTPVDLRPLAPLLPPALEGTARIYPLVVHNTGNPDLVAEKLTAFEVAWSATLDKSTITLAAYRNEMDDAINFATLLPSSEFPNGLPGFTTYSPDDPPPGMPAELVRLLSTLPAALGGPVVLPKDVARYLNLGPVRQRGLELSIDHRPVSGVSLSASYSLEKEPQILEPRAGQIRFPTLELPLPPRHRGHFLVSIDRPGWLASLSVTATSRTFWNNVLGLEYAAYTKAGALLNLTAGARFAGGRATALVRGTNLASSGTQQHIFGDIIGPSVSLELRLTSRKTNP